MRAFWIKFTDGSEACCEGQTDYDAQQIAEKISGKTVAGSPNKWTAGEVKPLPYPASPRIWGFDHPCNGKTPTFCYAPKECNGKSSCQQRRSCTE